MKQLLDGSSSVWLPLLSGSMAPSLLPGDELYIEPIQGSVRVGQICVFYSKGKFFSHRVLAVLPAGRRKIVLEKGDGNMKGAFMPINRVIGTVTRYRRDEIEIDLTIKEERSAARQKALRSFCRMARSGLLKWAR